MLACCLLAVSVHMLRGMWFWGSFNLLVISPAQVLCYTQHVSAWLNKAKPPAKQQIEQPVSKLPITAHAFDSDDDHAHAADMMWRFPSGALCIRWSSADQRC